MKPLKKNKHREDVKALIRKRDTSLSALSLDVGLALDTLAKSLIIPMPRANKAISKFLNVALHDLWPEWYDQAGQRIKYSGNKSEHKQKKSPSHCQKSTDKSAQGDRL